MDPALKAKWIEALRSGKYRQAKNALRTSEGYCCLGVLCDIQGADFGKIKARYGSLSLSSNPLEYIGMLGTKSDVLAKLNDSGKPFSEIADYIEEHL